MSTVKSFSKVVSTCTLLPRLTASLLRWSAILLLVSSLFLTFRHCSPFLTFAFLDRFSLPPDPGYYVLFVSFSNLLFSQFLSSSDFQYQSLYHFSFFLMSFLSCPYYFWPSYSTVIIIIGGCLCYNCTPSSLSLLIFDWSTFSRRVVTSVNIIFAGL